MEVMASRIASFTLTMPRPDREKRIWLYLPADYSPDGRQRFPVIYMQDGQDLFDAVRYSGGNPYIDESLNRQLEQSYRWYGSWRLDRRLDELFAEREGMGVIIAGVSSAETARTAEYSPWAWYGTANPEGDDYVEFLVRTLKPHVDAHYATARERDGTAIAGSSIGGLLALYAGLKHPDVFSGVAAFSPVLTRNVFGQRLIEFIEQRGKSHDMKIYVDLGSNEPGFGPIEPVHEALRAVGFPDETLWFRHIPGGEHRVEDWGRRFPEALLWLYPDASGRAP
jgi:predicted alpha/beta superfamily hydrolase